MIDLTSRPQMNSNQALKQSHFHPAPMSLNRLYWRFFKTKYNTFFLCERVCVLERNHTRLDDPDETFTTEQQQEIKKEKKNKTNFRDLLFSKFVLLRDIGGQQKWR